MRLLFVVFGLLLLVGTVAFAAEAPVVRPPDLEQIDMSGALGRNLNYLCLRQLGADCRDRLVFGRESYLKDTFTQAKPGQRMGESQIRPLASIAFAGSALLTFGSYDESATGFARRDMGRMMVSLIRELAEHHVANTDKSSWWWGNEWQSAYWTALAGQGAWLMWNRLPASTGREVASMVACEADRFLNTTPPHNEFLDTKAEENAWNSEVMVLAACMMPDHPNRAAWEQKAKEYIITSFATPEDITSERVVEGKPLKDWLRGPNVHSDFTAENHGFFHPDYTTSYYLAIENWPFYKLAGITPPDSLLYNVPKMRDILSFLTLPSGWTYYPQYTDWSNYRHDVTIMAQIPNPIMPSPEGARCLRWGLDAIRYADGFDAGKTSKNLFRGLNFNGCPLDTMTHVYLMHYLFGPGAEPLGDEQARDKLSGTRLFEQGKCVVCRSRDAMASFSWFDSGRRLMACVTPMEPDCIALPKFRSLIGTIGGKIDDAKITRRETELLGGGGYVVRVEMQRGPEFALNEKVIMAALPDGRVIWAEWFTGKLPDGAESRTGLLFYENNPFWLRGTNPRVYYPSGAWELTDKPLTLSSNDGKWLNISDKFGIVVRGSKSVLIENGQLSLNYRPANGGELAPCSVIVFYPNADRAATARASESIKIDGLGTGAVTVDLGDRRVELDCKLAGQ